MAKMTFQQVFHFCRYFFPRGAANFTDGPVKIRKDVIKVQRALIGFGDSCTSCKLWIK